MTATWEIDPDVLDPASYAPGTVLDVGEPLVAGRIVLDEIVPARASWSGVVRAGHVLTIVDVGGNQAGDCLMYNLHDTDERYSAPDTITAVALRSACFHAFGSSGNAATKSMMSSSAATRRGAARLLASGMKISAEPKPENPRAVPDTKAIAQIAIAVLLLIPAGMRPARLML